MRSVSGLGANPLPLAKSQVEETARRRCFDVTQRRPIKQPHAFVGRAILVALRDGARQFHHCGHGAQRVPFKSQGVVQALAGFAEPSASRTDMSIGSVSAARRATLRLGEWGRRSTPTPEERVGIAGSGRSFGANDATLNHKGGLAEPLEHAALVETEGRITAIPGDLDRDSAAAARFDEQRIDSL